MNKRPEITVFMRHPDAKLSVVSLFTARDPQPIKEFVDWLYSESLLGLDEEYNARLV